MVKRRDIDLLKARVKLIVSNSHLTEQQLVEIIANEFNQLPKVA